MIQAKQKITVRGPSDRLKPSFLGTHKGARLLDCLGFPRLESRHSHSQVSPSTGVTGEETLATRILCTPGFSAAGLKYVFEDHIMFLEKEVSLGKTIF